MKGSVTFQGRQDTTTNDVHQKETQMYMYAEIKVIKNKKKIVALIDSTSKILSPENGGDYVIPLDQIQYDILSAVHGNLNEARQSINLMKSFIDE
jgi:hypothetical protein